MTLFLLTLAATGCLLAGVALGYYLGHSDGYDRGWVARSYAPEPRWLELVTGDRPAVIDGVVISGSFVEHTTRESFTVDDG